MTPKDIKDLRKKMGLNTKDFGALAGVSGRTIENWEQERAKPRGPAIIILKALLKKHTKTVVS